MQKGPRRSPLIRNEVLYMSEPTTPAAILSERIAALRRECGLTQEQLGRRMGVSAQAVSKWEKGGAPDLALLPLLADRLGVSIDALFGRESGAPADAAELACRYIVSLPEGERLGAVCRLAWKMLQGVSDWLSGFPASGLDYMSSAYYTTPDGEELCLRALIDLPEGFAFGVGAQDISFLSIWPEPAAGYDAMLAGNEEYRALFACLAKPGCLELLRYLLSEPKKRWFVPAVAARETGLPLGQAEAALASLCEQGLLGSLELTLETGPATAYTLQAGSALLPTLCMARYLIGATDVYALCWDTRKKPLLRGPNAAARRAGAPAGAQPTGAMPQPPGAMPQPPDAMPQSPGTIPQPPGGQAPARPDDAREGGPRP